MELIQEYPVRTIEVDGETMFCAIDVAKLFKLKRPYDSINNFCKDAVITYETNVFPYRLGFIKEKVATEWIRKHLCRLGFDEHLHLTAFMDSIKKGEMPVIDPDKIELKQIVINPVVPKNDRKAEIYQLILKLNSELMDAVKELYGECL